MANYVLFTKLPPDTVKDPAAFKELARRVSERIRAIGNVRWLASYSVLGPYDVIDFFDAPDTETAMQVALTIRAMAGADTQTYPAIPWEGFLGIAGKVGPG